MPEADDSERRCIVTGAVGPKAGLVRFVVSPEGEVVADIDERLPGRGIWLSARRDVVNTALSRRLFAKAARRAVDVEADLADRLEARLARRALETIGLARRAGQAVCGFDKVRAEVKGGRVAVLVIAADAAPDSRRKMVGPAVGVALVELFSAAELGQVFGREGAVHVSLAAGRLAARFVEDADRLAGFRQTDAAAAGCGSDTKDEVD